MVAGPTGNKTILMDRGDSRLIHSFLMVVIGGIVIECDKCDLQCDCDKAALAHGQLPFLMK